MSGQPPPQWPPGQQPQLYPQQYPPQYPPQQMWYPPIQQPPRNDSRIIAIVVVVVVLVVIVPTVLAAALYVMVSGLLGGHDFSSRPDVTFNSITKDGTPPNNHTAMWSVGFISSSEFYDFSFYKAKIFKDGVPIVSASQTLSADEKIPFGTVTLIVRDIAGEGLFTSGDTFLVYGMGETHNWRLALIWATDETEIQSASWSTP